jgi:hypothetical protein
MAARQREEAAAEQIDRLCSRLAGDVPVAVTLRGDDRKIRQAQRRLRRDVDELGVQAAYLPEEQRALVLLARDMFNHADEIAPDKYHPGFHYDGVFTISRRIAQEVHGWVAAFLRHQPLPELTLDFREYQLALESLYKERQWEFAPEMHEDETNRKQWLQRNPGFATELGEPEPETDA